MRIVNLSFEKVAQEIVLVSDLYMLRHAALVIVQQRISAD